MGQSIGVKLTGIGMGGLILASTLAPRLWAAEKVEIKAIKSILYLTKSYTDGEANFKEARNLIYDQLTQLNKSNQANGRPLKVNVETVADVEDFQGVDPDQLCAVLAERLYEARALPESTPIAQNLWRLRDVKSADLVFVVTNTRGQMAASLGRESFSCDGESAKIYETSQAPFIIIDRAGLETLAKILD